MVDWVTSIVKIGSSAFAPKNKCVLDNICFKLYYKVTTTFLMACVLLLTGSLWVGKPISCITQQDQIPKDMFENHCLVTGTTTIYNTNFKADDEWRYANPYPGIFPDAALASDSYKQKKHPWYKWTAVILFIMAGAFYLPHLLWKLAEGGRLNALRQDMGGKKILNEVDRDQQRKLAVECLMQSRGNSNVFYYMSFFGLEWINVAIAVAVMAVLNLVFQNQYLEFGLDNVYLLFLKSEYARYDPMERVFPKVASCEMQFFGPSGTLSKVDGICFLYHNYLNEIIFLGLWFWLCFIAGMTVIYITVTRGFCLFKCTRRGLLMNKCAASNPKDIYLICDKLGLCDWFLLNALLSQITPAFAHAVIVDVAAELRKKKVDHSSSQA